jgi:RNA polymerase primary sigma factor
MRIDLGMQSRFAHDGEPVVDELCTGSVRIAPALAVGDYRGSDEGAQDACASGLAVTVPDAEESDGIDERDLVGMYLRDAARYPRLTAEQERDLSRRILEDHDEDAAAMLTQCNLRLVVRVAKGYQAQGLGLLDLIQEGNIGLMKAVRRYDGRKGFRFSTYAVWWISQQITRAIWSSHGPMKIPARIIDEHRRTMRAQRERLAAGDAGACDAAAADIPEPASPWSIVSVSSVEAVRRIDSMPADEAESPMQYAENRELLGTIFQALHDVSRRDQEIITELFGLNDTAPLRLEQVATSHHLTCERVRQIKKKIFESVRQSPVAEQLASSY